MLLLDSEGGVLSTAAVFSHGYSAAKSRITDASMERLNQNNNVVFTVIRGKKATTWVGKISKMFLFNTKHLCFDFVLSVFF